MRLIDITMIGVGAMIGAGIFVLTGIAAGTAGPALLLVFFLNGIVALLAAASYAELGGAILGAGGGYLYVKASLPNPSGFLAGWMSWFAQAVACSLYALGFGAYFRQVLEVVGIANVATPIVPLEIWLAVGACALLAWINFRGASEAGKAGNAVTIGKIVIIGLFITAGLWVMAGRSGWQASFSPFLSQGWTGVLAAMGLTFIAFEGYEIVAQTGEEVENPRRNVPLAVFLCLLIVIPIYLLVAFVAVGATIPPAGTSVTAFLGQEKEIALATAANQFVTGGGLIILVGGLLSTLSALNATIYSSSRVAYAMARDASLPKALARVHPKRGTPYVAIIFSAIIVIVMAVALPIEQVAASAGVMFLLLFVAVNISLIRLRRTRPDLERGFKVPFVPLTPILGIIAMLLIAGLMTLTYPTAWVAAGGWIALGLVFYYTYSRHQETAHQARTTWMERIERSEYRVLVALSSIRTLPSIMEAALGFAQARSGEVVLVHVMEVPEGEALDSRSSASPDVLALLETGVKYAEARGVAARSVVKIGHRISHAIVQTAREEECNFLVIGQPHTQSFFERLVSSIVERVLQQSPCQVAVVYGTIDRDAVRRVVVPVTGGPNSLLAAQLAPTVAGWFGAEIRALTVVDRAMSEDESRELTGEARETLKTAALDVPLKAMRSADPVRGFRKAIGRQELVLIGAPRSGPVVPLFGDTVPAIIARGDRHPVIVVRAVEVHATKFFDRAFFGRT
jgi:amino acid transporter/nucleotide-binding universal stress UspA family protein